MRTTLRRIFLKVCVLATPLMSKGAKLEMIKVISTGSFILFFLLSFFHMTAESHGLTLRWDESQDAGVVGYKVYYGLAPGTYSMSIDVGNSTESALCGFYEGRQHYAAVTAYNGLMESSFSNEVSYAINDGVLAVDDNCPNTPNGRSLGSCSKLIGGVPMGLSGSKSYFVSCTSDDDCEFYGGICQMDQEDFNNNGMGDACECYADVNHDGMVNTSDLGIMKTELFITNCTTVPCLSDINDDGTVNTSDLGIMKVQFFKTGCPIS